MGRRYKKSDQQITKQYERYLTMYNRYKKTMVPEAEKTKDSKGQYIYTKGPYEYAKFKDKLLYNIKDGKHDAVKSIVQNQFHSRSQTAFLRDRLREAKRLIKADYDKFIDAANEKYDGDIHLIESIKEIRNMNMRTISIDSEEEYNRLWDLIYKYNINELLFEAGFVYTSD